MKGYLVKTPKFVQRLFHDRIWAFSSSQNNVYLTFDDGPIPEITPWVLCTLKKYNAKATFFCIGDNVRKYPEIFTQILSDHHAVGNHTFNHLRGWKTAARTYVEDVAFAEKEMCHAEKNVSITTRQKLFRPPYGRMTSKQAGLLAKQGYQIIMWDVLSADFDEKISEEQCLQHLIENIEPGSIIVFHDSIKAAPRLKFALPKILDFISEKGWNCSAIVPPINRL